MVVHCIYGSMVDGKTLHLGSKVNGSTLHGEW